MHDDTTPTAVGTGLAVRLEQPLAHPLAGHLHQPETGDLGDLMTGTVPTEAFGQAPQHKLAVALQDHVDEVDDDDATDVTEPELTDDLFGGLQVVLGNGLLEISALTGELAGIDVDDGHGLGPVDHE